jgi:phosphatidylglycerophosphatase A
LLWLFLPKGLGAQMASIAIVFVVGSWSAHVAERHFQTTDPGPVVIDEVLGMLVTLLAIPVGWKGALAGFFVFRLFDVIKPYPANRLEALPGGLGVMADDLMAGVYANIALRALLAMSARLALRFGVFGLSG